MPQPMYTTVQSLRDLGITSMMVEDARLEALIGEKSSIIDLFTGQFFESRDGDSRFDGNDRRVMLFSVPIISISELYINGSDTPLPASYYVGYVGTGVVKDNRRNPKIALKGSVFCQGFQNHRVVGSFGFVESDGSTPTLIARATNLLVIEALANPDIQNVMNMPPIIAGGAAGEVLREISDGHAVHYGGLNEENRRPGLSNIIENREVLGLLNLFKAPMGIAHSINWN